MYRRPIRGYDELPEDYAERLEAYEEYRDSLEDKEH